MLLLAAAVLVLRSRGQPKPDAQGKSVENGSYPSKGSESYPSKGSSYAIMRGKYLESQTPDRAQGISMIQEAIRGNATVTTVSATDTNSINAAASDHEEFFGFCFLFMGTQSCLVALACCAEQLQPTAPGQYLYGGCGRAVQRTDQRGGGSPDHQSTHWEGERGTCGGRKVS